MNSSADQAKFLRIYLQDHLAGATAGAQRAARLAVAEAESPNAATLAGFAADVAVDLQSLMSVMNELGVAPSRLKSAISSVAERVGTLKTNGRLVERSPLSTVIELEAMQMAVRAKHSLWESLQSVVAPLNGTDFDRLISGADEQLAALSSVHADSVPHAFKSPVDTSGAPRDRSRQPNPTPYTPERTQIGHP